MSISSPLAPFTVRGSPGWGAMFRGWEVEVARRAAEIQDRAAGSRERVERGGQGATELLRVVTRVVLCDDLLRRGGSSGASLGG